MQTLPKPKIIQVPALGCRFKWNSEWQQLEFSNQLSDGSFEEEFWGVDENMVGGELVTYKAKEATLSEVYRDIEKRLGV